MGRSVVAVVWMILALGASSTVAAAQEPPYAPGEVLVRFAPGVDAHERAQLRREHGVRALQGLTLPRLQRVRVPEDRSVPAIAAELARAPGVLYAEPNYLYAPLAVPNDTFFDQQWGLDNTGQTIDVNPPIAGTPDADIDAPEAWNTTTGSSDVVVAILDTGMAYDHPDLEPNVWTNAGETGAGKATNGMDDDLNGFVDDFRGWDFFANDNDPADANGHGTQAGSIVGARGDNNREMTGINWRVRLMPVRIGSGFRGDITVANITDAFLYAADNGADVVNGSFGGKGLTQAMIDAVEEAPGTLFVVGAGNDGTDNDADPFYPCNLTAPNLICVAATDTDDDLAGFSNFGAQSVDVAAPGTQIVAAQVVLKGTPLWTETFEAPITTTWTTSGAWARSDEDPKTGVFGLTDSPGGNYSGTVTTTLARNAAANPIDLTGERGCHLTAQVKLDSRTETVVMGSPPRDDFVVLSAPEAGGSGAIEIGRRNGSIPSFTLLGFDLSELENDATGFVFFAMTTNNDGQVADGVHLDDLAVHCLDTTYPDPSLAYVQGTSFATPMVSGVAALVMADEPALTPVQVKARILATVDPIPELAGKVLTGGRVNAAKAVTPPLPPPPPDDDDDDDVTPPPPAPPPDTGPPATPITPPPPLADTIAPTLVLSGSTRQRARARRITISVRCPAEACNVTGKGRRLRTGTASLQAGATGRLVLRISRANLKAIRRALRRRRTVSVVVTITATDAAGNVTTQRRTIRLRR